MDKDKTRENMAMTQKSLAVGVFRDPAKEDR
jgi:hypothetical protein